MKRISLYLCHKVFLSTLVDTDTLPWRGDRKPCAHTGTFPYSRRQTGLDHMLRAHRRHNRNVSATKSKTTQAGSSALLHTHTHTSLTALSYPAGAAAAPSGLFVTLAAVLTFTLLLAFCPEPTRFALCVSRKKTGRTWCKEPTTAKTHRLVFQLRAAHVLLVGDTVWGCQSEGYRGLKCPDVRIKGSQSKKERL